MSRRTAASNYEGATQSPIFELESVGANAAGRDSDLGFIVLAGSTARKEGTSSFPQGYRSMRDQFVADGKLVDDVEAGFYRFAADVAFPSQSAAASVVMAGSANGPKEWKECGSGRGQRRSPSCQQKFAAATGSRRVSQFTAVRIMTGSGTCLPKSATRKLAKGNVGKISATQTVDR